MPRHPAAHRHRPLSVVRDDQLADIQVDGVGTVPMSGEQYTAAVHALAALIETWRSTQVCLPARPEDPDLPLVA